MPNDVPTNLLTYSFLDYSGEPSSTTVATVQAADNAAFETARQAFQNMVATVSECNIAQYSYSINTRLTNVLPTNPSAQRERKLLISYQDNVTLKKFQVTIPGFDDSAVTFILNTDNIDLVNGYGATVKSEFEAFVLSPPPALNPITVLEARAVGRNL